MKRRTWIAVDVSCLAYRSFYIMGDLEFDGEGTGVLFGIFRDILILQQQWHPVGIAFCFDHRENRRKRIYAEYKSGRSKEMSEEEQEARLDMFRQIDRLYKRDLSSLGFRNVFRCPGYEADDLIASVCENSPTTDRVLIVSTDNDLWQLLSHRVAMWSPTRQKLFTAKWFDAEYGIDPPMWADVKAIAGCSSDGVPGVKGVGEITASKYLSGNLGESTKAYKAIISSHDIYERNLKLVRLPFVGMKSLHLRPDEVDAEKWKELMDSLGIRSLDYRSGRKGRRWHGRQNVTE
ncbi:MAG: 5'-3' exonuclease [Candidatus Methanospirareceae archaeon]